MTQTIKRDIFSGAYGAACQNALHLTAQADKSDPFAVRRLRTHLLNGVEDDPAAVAKQAQLTVEHRQAAILASYEKWKASGSL